MLFRSETFQNIVPDLVAISACLHDIVGFNFRRLTIFFSILSFPSSLSFFFSVFLKAPYTLCWAASRGPLGLETSHLDAFDTAPVRSGGSGQDYCRNERCHERLPNIVYMELL